MKPLPCAHKKIPRPKTSKKLAGERDHTMPCARGDEAHVSRLAVSPCVSPCRPAMLIAWRHFKVRAQGGQYACAELGAVLQCVIQFFARQSKHGLL